MSFGIIVCSVALWIMVACNVITTVALIKSDKRRIKAEEELTRLKARQRIHQWGPGDAAEDFREACK